MQYIFKITRITRIEQIYEDVRLILSQPKDMIVSLQSIRGLGFVQKNHFSILKMPLGFYI